MTDAVLSQWEQPANITKRNAKAAFYEYRFAPIFITIFTALTFLPMYIVLKPILPNNDTGISWEVLFFILVIGSFLGSCLVFYVGLYFSTLRRTQYIITEEHLKIESSAHKTYNLTDITGYIIKHDTDFQDILQISLFHKIKKRPILLFIADNEVSNQILFYFAEHFTEFSSDEVDQDILVPTTAQSISLLIFSYILSVVLAYYSGTYLGKQWIMAISFIVFILGPGTIGIILLFRNLVWKNKHLFFIAIIYNSLSWVLYFVYAVCFNIQNMINETKLS